MSASAWLDRKLVTIMSTNCQPDASGTVLRGMQDGSRCHAPSPSSCITPTWVEWTEGISYVATTKSRKFYKYIFYFLLDVAITNAFILTKHHTANGSKMTIKDFRLQLASQLIGEYCSRRRRGRTSSSIRPLPLRHFPIKINEETNPAKRRRGNCAQCRQTNNKRMNTSWFCRECSKWLCHSGDPDDCFMRWHRNHVSQYTVNNKQH